MRKSIIDVIKRHAIVSALVLPVSAATAQYVEITAEIETVAYRSDQPDAEAKATPRKFSVLCTTGNDRWRIENDWSVGGLNKWFFDGTNIYESLQIVKPPPEETQEHLKSTLRFATVPFEQAKSNLTINIWPAADSRPLGDVAVNIPWLAFCSGPYLKRQGRLIPLPCDILRHTPDRSAYSDKTETFQDAFGLPSSVELFLSKSLYLASVDDFYLDWEFNQGSRHSEWMKNAVTNLEEGVLTFHYAVTATTNFLGWTIPLRFEFFQAGRKYVQNGAWNWRGVGTLKSIQEGAEPQNLFNTNMQQTIVDWRFRDPVTKINANTYNWTNSFVPNIDDPELQDKFRRRVEKIRGRLEQEK